MDLFLTLSADCHNERHRERRRHFFCKFALVRDLDAARLAHSPVAIRNHAHIQAPQSGFQSSIQHFSVNLVLGKFLITGTSQKMCEPATTTTMRIGNDDHGIGVDPDGVGVYGFPGQAGPQLLTSTDVRVGVHSPLPPLPPPPPRQGRASGRAIIQAQAGQLGLLFPSPSDRPMGREKVSGGGGPNSCLLRHVELPADLLSELRPSLRDGCHIGCGRVDH